MYTNKDYTTSFRHYGQITVPKGTRVTHETATGIDTTIHFVDSFIWVKENYPEIAQLLKHDLYYYGLDIPKDFVTTS